MLLTIKCDMLELVGAQSKDKEISCELPNCIEGYLISKAGKKYPAAVKWKYIDCQVVSFWEDLFRASRR